MRIFTDRIESQKNFWASYDELINTGSTIITFYGAGGIGKTRLAEKLTDEFAAQKIDNVKYLFHDFINGTDMRSILRRWKNELGKCGCEFPLFETGDFYLFVKQGGRKITEQQFKSWVGKSKLLTQIKNVLELGSGFVDNGIPALNAAAATLDLTSDALNIFPGIKTFAGLAGIIDKFMSKREHDKNLNSHAEIRDELNSRLEERNLFELEKFLPFLFAQDVADWMELSDKKLIIFLETYELLEGATGNRLEAHNLYRDWWIHSEAEDAQGLTTLLPDTLWVISGRGELHWKGELAENIKPHLLEPLTQEDSLEFLTKAKVEPPELREEIFKLTEGYPLYLNVCVDFYEQYLSGNGTAPPIAEFGTKREKIIERLMKYADGDLRLMIDGLAILGTWTDELASKIIYSYDPNVYLDAKKFSFVHQRNITLDDSKLEVFHFDRTLQKFIVDAIKADEDLNWLTDEALIAADKYFEPLLDGREFIDETFCFYIRLWADLIVNLTDDAELLQTRYEEKLFGHVRNMIDVYEVATADDILTAFQDKIIELAGEENIPCAYFDGEFFYLEKVRGNYEDALARAQWSWQTYFKLLGEKHPDTIAALARISSAYLDLEDYEEALDFNEKILEVSAEVFGENHPRTIDVIEKLSNTWAGIGNVKRALDLERQVLKFRREKFGEDDYLTVTAMNNLAGTLSNFGEQLDEALTLQEKVVKYFKEHFGEADLDTLGAEYNLAGILRNLERYDEALKIDEKVFNLRKEILGENHPDTISAMFNLSTTLSLLGRKDESIKLNERVFELQSKFVAGGEIFSYMEAGALASRFSSVGRHEEAVALWKRIIESIYKTDSNGDIRDYIDSGFDAKNEADIKGGLQVIGLMTCLAEALLEADKNDEALSWADHALTLGEKIFPVLAETDDEFYEDVNFSTSSVKKWHETFLKKIRGEFVETADVRKLHVRTYALRTLNFNEED